MSNADDHPHGEGEEQIDEAEVASPSGAKDKEGGLVRRRAQHAAPHPCNALHHAPLRGPLCAAPSLPWYRRPCRAPAPAGSHRAHCWSRRDIRRRTAGTAGRSGGRPAPHARPRSCQTQVLPISRVKKLIKAEADVKVVSNEAVFLIGRAVVRWQRGWVRGCIEARVEEGCGVCSCIRDRVWKKGAGRAAASRR
jgi:hypothetical protein